MKSLSKLSINNQENNNIEQKDILLEDNVP